MSIDKMKLLLNEAILAIEEEYTDKTSPDKVTEGYNNIVNVLPLLDDWELSYAALEADLAHMEKERDFYKEQYHQTKEKMEGPLPCPQRPSWCPWPYAPCPGVACVRWEECSHPPKQDGTWSQDRKYKIEPPAEGPLPDFVGDKEAVTQHGEPPYGRMSPTDCRPSADISDPVAYWQVGDTGRSSTTIESPAEEPDQKEDE